MTFFRDLETCAYFRNRSPRLVAVGWLSSAEPYQQGEMAEDDRRRLKALVAEAWQPFFYRGLHFCEFCASEADSRNLFVPGDGVIFAAPAMILHYVEKHFYAPPRLFLDKVRDCPTMGSDEYFAALVEQGGRELEEALHFVEPEPTPCPFCGEALMTPRAKQCRFCKMDWHDPDNPRPLRPN